MLFPRAFLTRALELLEDVDGGLHIARAAQVSTLWRLACSSSGVRRRFVVLLTRPPPPCFCSCKMEALATDHRLDLLARCCNSALFLSDATRRDTELLLVFAPAASVDEPVTPSSSIGAGTTTGTSGSEHETGGASESASASASKIANESTSESKNNMLDTNRAPATADSAARPCWVLRLHGGRVRHLRPDEKTIASIMARAMFPIPCHVEHRVMTVEKRSQYPGVERLVKTRKVPVRVCVPLGAQPATSRSVQPPKVKVGGGSDGSAHPAQLGERSHKCCRGVSFYQMSSLRALLESLNDAHFVKLELQAPRTLAQVLSCHDYRTRAGGHSSRPRPYPRVYAFFLGDDRGFSALHEQALSSYVHGAAGSGTSGSQAHTSSIVKCTLGGGRMLLTSHCIVLIQHYLDMHAAERCGHA